MKATSQGVSAGGWCRRAVMAGASAFVLGASLLGFAGAAEAQQGDRIRKIVLVTAPQAGDPQEFQEQLAQDFVVLPRLPFEQIV